MLYFLAGFTILNITRWAILSETSPRRGSQTFNKCDASVCRMICNESFVFKGGYSVFLGCQGFLLSIYIRVQKRAALAWRKFPICHYSQTCPFTFSPSLSDLPVQSRTGDTWEQYCGQTVLAGLFLSISESLSDACSHFTHCEPRNNCGSRRAHLAFRSVIWIRGNAFPYCN